MLMVPIFWGMERSISFCNNFLYLKRVTKRYSAGVCENSFSYSLQKSSRRAEKGQRFIPSVNLLFLKQKIPLFQPEAFQKA